MGFIQLEQDGRRYTMTERGGRYLDAYEEMMRMMDHRIATPVFTLYNQA
jgi:predicted transcriptional regulator